MAAKKSCNAVCFKDERKKEDPLSTEIQRQCEGKMIPSTLPMLFVDFAAQVLYTALAWHKSPHQPTSLFMKSPFQFSFYALSSKQVTFRCLYRHEKWPWGSEDLYKEPWKRISDHMPLSWRRWGKQESQSVFYVPVHVRNWIKPKKKVTNIWSRVIEGSKDKKEDKFSRPRMRDPGEIQPGQPITE